MTLSKIIGSHGQSYTTDLFVPSKNKSRGKIIIKLEKVSTSNDVFYFTGLGTNFPSK